jgi:molybdenum cofactor biosynthesis protein B
VAHREHRERAPVHLGCAVLTVSDTRSEAQDASGRSIRERLVAAGHRVLAYRLVPDEPWAIAWTLQKWCLEEEIDAILVNGGTGIAQRDHSPDTIESLLERRLEGFGERFRSRSEEQVGSAAYLSRAVAGVRNGKVIYALPGSQRAVELALDALILPELGHVVGELRK